MAETAQKAVHRFPANPYFAFSAASALSQLKKTDEALQTLDTINTDMLDPKVLSLLYSTRGDILYSIEQADSAFANYNKAIKLNPENFMAMNNAAYYMSEKGVDLDNAELYASIATASDPENVTFLDTHAWVMFKKKEYKQAREIMDKALKISGIIEGDDNTSNEEPVDEQNKPSAEIYDHAGYIYFMSGDHAEAVEFWKEALKLDPENEAIKKKVTHRTYFFE